MKGKLLIELIGGALASAAAFWSGGAYAGAAGTVGVCQLADASSIDCTYWNPNGIKSVFVSVSTPDGVVPVVNEVYDCETPVSFTVHLGLAPVQHWEVDACPPGEGVGGDNGIDGLKTPTQPVEPPATLGYSRASSSRIDGETVLLGGLTTTVPEVDSEALLILIRPHITK